MSTTYIRGGKDWPYMLGITPAIIENNTQTDSITTQLGAGGGPTNHTRSFSDSSGSVDTLTRTRTVLRTLNDAALFSTGDTVGKGIGKAVTDTHPAADTQLRAGDRSASTTDPAGSTDTTSAQKTGAYSGSKDDLAGATDTSSQVKDAAGAAQDSSGSSDSITISRGYGRTATDTHPATDTRTTGYHPAPVDGAGASDTWSRTKPHTVEVTDLSGGPDYRASTGVVTVNDAAGTTDSHTLSLAIHRTTQDPAGTTDPLERLFSLTAVEPAGRADTLLRSADLGRAHTDDTGLVDTADTVRGHQDTHTDLAGLTDTLTGVLRRPTDIDAVLDDTAGSTDTTTYEVRLPEPPPIAHARLDFSHEWASRLEFTT